MSDKPTAEQRAQPHLVVCFGMMSYKVLFEHKDRAVARSELRYWQGKAGARGGVEVLPLTRHAKPGDFQLRQQWDLDELAKAIISSYPERA